MSEPSLSLRLRQDVPIPLDVEVTCSRGEVLALVGPSGSGKSTTLRSIAGLYTPREAYIRCNGSVWADTQAGISQPPHLRRAGLVFQSYALFPHMNALSNIMAAMGHVPRSARAARARSLLSLVHLDGLEGRRPAELSGGQQQRVAIARALARDPDVLLLDEPFSAVDKATRQRLYGELAELRQKLSIPIVLVTHDFDEAARLADRMCLLDRGKVLQIGVPADVLARPVSVTAARLVNLKNLFFGTILRHDADRTLIDWNGRVIAATRHEAFPPGERIAWALPSTQVILQRQDAKEREQALNLLSGVVADVVSLSESTAIAVEIHGADAPVLSMTVPSHFVRRTGISRGAPVAVQLLIDGIHVMSAGDGVA
jgi:molybdate transport system ATP-binding protein